MNEVKKEGHIFNNEYCNYLKQIYRKYFPDHMSDYEVEEKFKDLYGAEYNRMIRVTLGGNDGIHKIIEDGRIEQG
jgi:hypothetical protein